MCTNITFENVVEESWKKVGRDQRRICWMEDFDCFTGSRDVHYNMNMVMYRVQWRRRLQRGDFQDRGPKIVSGHGGE